MCKGLAELPRKIASNTGSCMRPRERGIGGIHVKEEHVTGVVVVGDAIILSSRSVAEGTVGSGEYCLCSDLQFSLR